MVPWSAGPARWVRLLTVAFGQQLGPPASAKQVQELLTLLKEAGHTDFRDARGPMGFTQRQAGGKFARDEADQFIDRLRREESDMDTESAPDEDAGPTAALAPAGPARAGTGPGPGRTPGRRAPSPGLDRGQARVDPRRTKAG